MSASKNLDFLQHAYGIEGDVETISETLKDWFEKKLQVSTVGNPDFSCATYQSFSIEEARALAEAESRKSWGGDKKFFIIGAERMTSEAQNALLKIFEEPTAGTHFFLVVPTFSILLPTLRSRLAVFELEGKKDISKSKSSRAEEFLKLSPAERVALAKKMSENVGEGELSRQDVVALVSDVEKKLRGTGDITALPKEVITSLGEIDNVRKYLYDRSSSVKMILEHLSLIIPKE